jgi:N6-adenosine-specific RNA methylase IME4
MSQPAEEVRLARIEAGLSALAEATSVPEVKQIRDKAEAIRLYFQQQVVGLEAQNKAAELKLRAERRLGELLKEMEKRDGGDASRARLRGATELPPRLQDLGIEKTQAHRYQTIATLPEEAFEAHLAETQAAGQELTTAEVLRLAKRLADAERLDARQAVETPTCSTADLQALVARGLTFGTVYADPPWGYRNQATRGSTDGHYVTLSPEQIAADFKPYLHALAAPNAHLHLWTTNAFLFDAKAIMDAWGFPFKSVFVWVKPQLGLGNYYRVSHEFLLLGIKGQCPVLRHDVRSWIEAERGAHSDKPDSVAAMIETFSPPAYLELFGRRPRPRWVVYGNEIERTVFYQTLEAALVTTDSVG